MWTLAGYERIAGGALQRKYLVAQSWIVTPAPLEDLRKMELEWSRLPGLLAELRNKAG